MIKNQNNKTNKNKFKYLINEEINVKNVLLIQENEKNEEISVTNALQKAKSLNLDLVLINPMTTPPIAKILDYGKFIYQLKQKSKGTNKNTSKLKSITVKPQISEHDIQWKANKAIEWFKQGDRVQFLIRAPGRMSARSSLINQVFTTFCQLVFEYGRPKEELKKISKIQYSTYFLPFKK